MKFLKKGSNITAIGIGTSIDTGNECTFPNQTHN